ncbi:MAG: hypothetical protein E6G39_12275, partial [Actinobacteria bacterium]
MKRDRVVPELEVELRPAPPATDKRGRETRQRKPARDSQRRLFVVGVAVVVTMSVLIALSMVGDGPARQTVTPAPSPVTIAAPETTRTPTPGILGSASTSLLLWSVDTQSRLQVLDLDSGELRVLGNRGGIAFFALLRQIVIFDGD